MALLAVPRAQGSGTRLWPPLKFISPQPESFFFTADRRYMLQLVGSLFFRARIGRELRELRIVDFRRLRARASTNFDAPEPPAPTP